MHKSKIRVYSTSQLLFIFVQFLSPALAVPCYVGTSTTTKSDTTSGPEQCSVTERIPSSTAGSVTSSHTAKTTAPSPIGAPTPIFSLEKNDNADLSVPIKLNSTTPLLNPKNPINPLNLTTPFPPAPAQTTRRVSTAPADST
ncbi:uncharacterized protein DFL_005857 [Arthrobotrys flagrans]|uniref:Uncharacterized protein n=1 Tax=Arthrobotrys flagrans TaxID=97331 RepID=A0A436ZZ18_ARTFL|nr:hypothetical protein DFL_005857 [Arthrobotrys flagrans]